MKTSRFGLVLACGMFAALTVGCEPVEVSVNCEKGTDGLDCEVKQTKGKAEAKVCWDYSMDCEGDVKVEAPNECLTVKDGGSAKVTIPTDKLKNLDKCTKSNGAKVSKVTINGQESK